MLLAHFIRSREGGVAPLLAIGLIPLVAAVGAAVDYSRAGSVRTAMQAAGDATALMLAKNASSLSADQLEQNAVSYFQANFHRPGAQNVQVSATYSQASSGFTVTVNSSASVATSYPEERLAQSPRPIEEGGVAGWRRLRVHPSVCQGCKCRPRQLYPVMD
jgi:Flp pilus assembly protein TadG